MAEDRSPTAYVSEERQPFDAAWARAQAEAIYASIWALEGQVDRDYRVGRMLSEIGRAPALMLTALAGDMAQDARVRHEHDQRLLESLRQPSWFARTFQGARVDHHAAVQALEQRCVHARVAVRARRESLSRIQSVQMQATRLVRHLTPLAQRDDAVLQQALRDRSTALAETWTVLDQVDVALRLEAEVYLPVLTAALERIQATSDTEQVVRGLSDLLSPS